jgi:hypothetical protein
MIILKIPELIRQRDGCEARPINPYGSRGECAAPATHQKEYPAQTTASFNVAIPNRGISSEKVQASQENLFRQNIARSYLAERR